MVYRFLVATIFTFAVFPFVAIYTFSLQYESAQFAFDSRTWLQGLAVILFGWVLFLLPGMLPFAADKYYPWVARKIGLTDFYKATREGISRTRVRLTWLRHWLLSKTSSIALPFKKSESTPPPDTQSYPVSSEAQPTTKKSKIRITEQLESAKHILSDAPRHFEQAKTHIKALRTNLTPDELQRSINLNQYTLEVISNLKRMLLLVRPTLELAESLDDFLLKTLNALPEPLSPGESQSVQETTSFVFPEDQRESLRHDATRFQIPIRQSDFELAENGDLERALYLALALVHLSLDVGNRDSASSLDDPMIGLQ